MEDFSQLSAQERADKVGCLIKSKVDAGEFKLRSGYLLKSGDVCRGCAIGSLAYSLGCDAGADFGLEGRDCRTFITQQAPTGLISRDEQYQLEMGYECWKHMPLVYAVADPADPFFQLGKKMSIAAGHRGEALYAKAFPEAK